VQDRELKNLGIKGDTSKSSMNIGKTSEKRGKTMGKDFF